MFNVLTTFKNIMKWYWNNYEHIETYKVACGWIKCILIADNFYSVGFGVAAVLKDYTDIYITYPHVGTWHIQDMAAFLGSYSYSVNCV